MTYQSTVPALDPCIDTEAAASFLGLSKAQIVKLRTSGILPAIVYGKKCIRHKVSDLAAYRDSMLRGGNGRPAMGAVHPNLTASRAKRPKPSGKQSHPAAPANPGKPANA